MASFLAYRAPEQVRHFHIVDKCVPLCGLVVRRPPFETNETIQQVRVFSAKVEYWSLISLAHMMEGENQILEVVFGLHMCTMANTHLSV